MHDADWLKRCSPAFRLMMATSWLAPEQYRDQQEQAIREAVLSEVDWAEYSRLVVRHRIPALSWSALKRVTGLAVPEDVKLQLQQRSNACHMEAVRHALILTEVLKGFNGAGIEIMPLKGPTLSFELYDDIGLRHFKDLDILVAPHDLSRAQACMEEMGWRPDASQFPMTPRQREAALRYEHHVGYVLPGRQSNLELHWTNLWDTDDQAARRWARSTTSLWRGRRLQSMDRIDLTLYLCNHGGEHAWFRAKWLGDVARLHTDKPVDWETVLHEARGSHMERSVWLCLRLLHDAYGLSVPVIEKLPLFLIEMSVGDMKTEAEPDSIDVLPRAWRVLRKVRYERLLRPLKSRRRSVAQLAYSRADFRVISLPDNLFWAYALLRPVIWVWRRLIRDGVPQISGR